MSKDKKHVSIKQILRMAASGKYVLCPKNECLHFCTLVENHEDKNNTIVSTVALKKKE